MLKSQTAQNNNLITSDEFLEVGVLNTEGNNINIKKGLFHINKAIELDPNNSNAYAERGRVRRDLLSNYEDAISDFEEEININSNPDAYCDLGITYTKLGDFQTAIDSLIKSIELDSAYASAYKNRSKIDVYYNLAINYSSIGDHDNAIKYLTKSIELDPNNSLAYAERARINRDVLFNYEEALTDFQKELGLQESGDAYFDIGLTYSQMSNHDLAIEYYSKAIRIGPKSLEFYKYRSISNTLIGDLPSAKSDLEYAINKKNILDKGAEYASQLRRSIQNLKFIESSEDPKAKQDWEFENVKEKGWGDQNLKKYDSSISLQSANQRLINHRQNVNTDRIINNSGYYMGNRRRYHNSFIRFVIMQILTSAIYLYLGSSLGGQIGLALGGFIWIILFIHNLPMSIAFARKHPSKWAIFLVNFCFGWTFIFWFICLVWSLGDVYRGYF